jgi:hypothetical protein
VCQDHARPAASAATRHAVEREAAANLRKTLGPPGETPPLVASVSLSLSPQSHLSHSRTHTWQEELRVSGGRRPDGQELMKAADLWHLGDLTCLTTLDLTACLPFTDPCVSQVLPRPHSLTTSA